MEIILISVFATLQCCEEDVKDCKENNYGSVEFKITIAPNVFHELSIDGEDFWYALYLDEFRDTTLTKDKISAGSHNWTLESGDNTYEGTFDVEQCEETTVDLSY